MGQRRYLYTLCFPHVTADEPIRMGRLHLSPGGPRHESTEKRLARNFLNEIVIPEWSCKNTYRPLTGHFTSDTRIDEIPEEFRKAIAVTRFTLATQHHSFSSLEYIVARYQAPLTPDTHYCESLINGSQWFTHYLQRDLRRRVRPENEIPVHLDTSKATLIRDGLQRLSSRDRYDFIVASEAYLASLTPGRYSDDFNNLGHVVRGIESLLRLSPRDGARAFGEALRRAFSFSDSELTRERLEELPELIQAWGTEAYNLRSVIAHRRRGSAEDSRDHTHILTAADKICDTSGHPYLDTGQILLAHLLLRAAGVNDWDLGDLEQWESLLRSNGQAFRELKKLLNPRGAKLSYECVIHMKRLSHSRKGGTADDWIRVLKKVLIYMYRFSQNDVFHKEKFFAVTPRSLATALSDAATTAFEIERHFAETRGFQELETWEVLYACQHFLGEAMFALPRLLAEEAAD